MDIKNSTILAKNKFLSLDTTQTKLNNNVLLVGASGRGKTRNFIKPNILQMNSNYVISDPKGVLVEEVGQVLKDNGYNIKILNLIDLNYSNTYNPFKYIKNDADVISIINFLIINTNPNATSVKQDPFWEKSETMLLSALMFYLIKYRPKEEQNFTSIMKLLRAAEVDENNPNVKSPLDRIFDEVAKRDSNSIALKFYMGFKVGAGKTLKSILMSCFARLCLFNIESYEHLIETDDINLHSLSEEKTAIFVIISDTDTSKNWLAGLFYSQLFDILCKTIVYPKYHIRFILDDFVCAGKIPDFDYKMATIRSRNLSAVVVVQDEVQLEKEYGVAYKSIISNCDSYVFLGSSNISSCEVCANRLSVNDITGTKIRKLPYDKCIVIYGNQGGIFEKYNLESHPFYSFVSDNNDNNSKFNYKYEGSNFDIAFRRKQSLDIETLENIKQNILDVVTHLTGEFNKKDINDKILNLINKTSFLKPDFSIKNFQKKEYNIIEDNYTTYRSTPTIDIGSIESKETFFDSIEEEYFYRFLNFNNINVFAHQHLRDVFISSSKSISKKLSSMHCDFILRDKNFNILCGIEIDGKQHENDEKQINNDIFKDEIFKKHRIKLFRFPAYRIRKNPQLCIYDIVQELKNSFNFETKPLYSSNETFEQYKKKHDECATKALINKTKWISANPFLNPKPVRSITKFNHPSEPIKKIIGDGFGFENNDNFKKTKSFNTEQKKSKNQRSKINEELVRIFVNEDVDDRFEVNVSCKNLFDDEELTIEEETSEESYEETDEEKLFKDFEDAEIFEENEKEVFEEVFELENDIKLEDINKPEFVPVKEETDVEEIDLDGLDLSLPPEEDDIISSIQFDKDSDDKITLEDLELLYDDEDTDDLL